MPRGKRATPPPSSFSPELHALLLKGSKESVTLTLSSLSSATSLRARLHSLRKSLREFNHYTYSAVAATTVRISRNADSPAVNVIVQPSDENFSEAIRNAGVNVEEELSEDVELFAEDFETPTTPKEPTPADLESFFDIIRKKSTN